MSYRVSAREEAATVERRSSSWWRWWYAPILVIVVAAFGVGAIHDYWSEPHRGVLTALALLLGAAAFTSGGVLVYKGTL